MLCNIFFFFFYCSVCGVHQGSYVSGGPPSVHAFCLQIATFCLFVCFWLSVVYALKQSKGKMTAKYSQKRSLYFYTGMHGSNVTTFTVKYTKWLCIKYISNEKEAEIQRWTSWSSGFAFCSITEVKQRPARLIRRWVTAFGSPLMPKNCYFFFFFVFVFVSVGLSKM